jgi:hypothetical protein
MNTKGMPPRLSAQVKDERARDRTAAMLEYQAERLAVETKTARLRAARLAKEAADPPVSVSKRKTTAPQKASDRVARASATGNR